MKYTQIWITIKIMVNIVSVYVLKFPVNMLFVYLWFVMIFTLYTVLVLYIGIWMLSLNVCFMAESVLFNSLKWEISTLTKEVVKRKLAHFQLENWRFWRLRRIHKNVLNFVCWMRWKVFPLYWTQMPLLISL